MSLIERLVAAVTPMESKEQRLEGRKRARAVAGRNDWLCQILDHHEQIDDLFVAVRLASDVASRLEALQELSWVLTGHANAEESVIYPALVYFGHKTHGMTGYTEHADAKANLGLLDYLDPMSIGFLDKLEYVRVAVAHHMYEEESDWFLDLKRIPAPEQVRLTARYMEEFHRYVDSSEDDPFRRQASRLGAQKDEQPE